ncbi:hypothetical protein GTQ34_08125 [Muricauda sp. JGD-17]|uniref:Conjugative transposon protein TraO n=1 Tax=Flagellimonas ochracea TaxID=2696472 RepID=A0A964TCZ5_9FLAO|nr:conjugal transfer protein TraO [Allomuricauda ochracea]NAY91881.1 hypothetical protein [Allomuricauda ochracea]
MKRKPMTYLGLMVLCILLSNQVLSQRTNVAIGMVPNYKTDGFGATLSLNYTRSSTDYLQAAVVAAFSKEQPNSGVEFPYEDYLFNLGYFTTVLSAPRKGIFFYFGGGPSVGYKHINDGNTEFPFDALEAESSFIYGGYASFEMDFFLSDAFSLIIPINGYYHFNSDLNDSMLLLGVGVRYYFK